MGWLDDLGKAIASAATAVADAVSDAAEAVANVIEDVINAGADYVADAVETAGNVMADIFYAVGNLLGSIPLIGPIIAWPWKFVGGIISGATNLVGAVIKGAAGFFGGVIGGSLKLFFGLITGRWDLALDGLIDIATSTTGAIISICFTALALVQRATLLQGFERPLTAEEKTILRIVFRNSISLYNIRIVDASGWAVGAGIFTRPFGAAFTLNNVIYVSGNHHPSVMVHECVHVWQYQNLGTRYFADAFGAQLLYPGETRTPGSSYDWQAELTRGITDWIDFNKEAQASLIADIWGNHGSLNVAGTIESGGGAFYKQMDFPGSVEKFEIGPLPLTGNAQVDRTEFAIASVRTLRGYFNARLSHFI